MEKEKFSIDELCQHIETYIQNTEISSRIVGLLKHGHECRNILLSLCPDSTRALDQIDEYDQYWLY